MNRSVGWVGVMLMTVALGGRAEGQVCCLAGDVNVDLQVGLTDMGAFVQALLDPAGMDERALCAADVNQDGPVDGGDIGPFIEVVLDQGQALFDYGPPRTNAEAEQIGLEMLGAGGALLVPDEDYDRIIRDLGLIRRAHGGLFGQMHSMAWLPNELLVKVYPDLPHDDYECLNTYYQVVNIAHLFGDWYVLTFAGNLNIAALGAIYVSAPEIQYADPNGLFGGENFWVPTPQGGGVWRWDIDDGFMDCFDGCDCHRYYVIEVDADGAVTLIDYQEVGMSWCEF